jgi:hypothetical protein
MSTDWILVDLAVPNEYYRKHTDLSYIFMLWGKKRLICPVKFMKRLRGTQTHFVFQMPKWWINQNNLRKFILDDDMNRVLFPPVIPIEEPIYLCLQSQLQKRPRRRFVEMNRVVYFSSRQIVHYVQNRKDSHVNRP